MEATLKANLAKLAEIFEEATGLPKTTIGSRAINHSKFFDRLSDPDTSITLKTYDRVVEWFAANWPVKARWPKGVARPTEKAAA